MVRTVSDEESPASVTSGAGTDEAPGSVALVGAGGQQLTAALVMVVDDEPINVKVTRKYLEREGYERFVTLTDGVGAVEAVIRERPDVVLLDVMMPEVSGLEVLRDIRAHKEVGHTPVFILTASTEEQTKRRALELGATDFLTKPVSPNDLIPRVRNALILKAHHDHLSGYAHELEERVRERTVELLETQLEVVHCLGRAAEFRDSETGNHIVRVGLFAGIIGRALGLGTRRTELLEHAAPLHDVGKIGIPDAILLKPDKLTPDEFELMSKHAVLGKSVLQPTSRGDTDLWRSHVSIGAKIIGDTDFPLLKTAAVVALTHHEKWDGSGYPLGLAGEDIPIEGRITAVADVFDALSSRRPYKPAFPREKCFAIMEQGRGSHFDPQVLDAFFAAGEEVVEVQLRYPDA